MSRLIVTIDGPGGSGKSTVARLLADRLSAVFLDTGAMYRAVTLAAMNRGLDLTDESQLLSVFDTEDFDFRAESDRMTVLINGEDFTGKIRTVEVTSNARYIASAAKVRDRLVQMQQDFASENPRMVTEGRDQGTVVFPDADFKFFLTASLEERAKRRAAEMGVTRDSDEFETIKNDLKERDTSDESRKVAPLKIPDDAVEIDTTELSLDEVVNKIARIIEKS
jgi:cytidylate kinase